MKRFSGIFLLIGCMHSAEGAFQASESACMSNRSPNVSKLPLEAAMNGALAKHQTPAIGAGVVSKTGTLQYCAVGRRKMGSESAVSQTDKFHLGSNTKSMTATMLAVLVEQGVLRWDMTLGEVFPEAINSVWENVQLQWLTSHFGGFKANLEDDKLLMELAENKKGTAASRKKLVQYALRSDPLVLPGSKFYYSNLGYVVAGHMAERVTGKAWETLMEELVFEPLNMTGCGFGVVGPDSNLEDPEVPWAHYLDEENGLVPIPPVYPYPDNPTAYGPAATVHCNGVSYASYLKEHLKGAKQKSEYLSTDSFALLHEKFQGSDYSIGGWNVVKNGDKKLLQHSGTNTFNYATAWLFLNEGLGFFAFTNSYHEDATEDVIDSLRAATHQ